MENYIGELILLCGYGQELGEAILKAPNNNQDVLSIDSYFINENGVYKYDETKLKEANNFCLLKCAERMKNELVKIVVANVFSEESELLPYFELAHRYKYRVHVAEIKKKFDTKL